MLTDSAPLRLRAVWLYYNRNATQKEIAEALGISRSTVIRMLGEARQNGEVSIWINATPQDCGLLGVALEERLGLDEAIVVPGHGTPDQTAQDVGAALGRFLSETIVDGLTIGVGWGRTLSASLATFRPVKREATRILSLLGGTIQPRTVNPADFSWQIASRLSADCLLMMAPLIVDSAATKRTLIDDCGLRPLFDQAGRLDLAVVSCGDVGAGGTSLSRSFLSETELASLVAAGAVCDVMCQFLDETGATVPHPIHDRVMSVDLDSVAAARHVVIASGGAHRAPAILASVRRLGCNTLITDEAAARAILARDDV